MKDKRGRVMCHCGGYWFPHRKGGGACEHSPTRDLHLAKRTKDPDVILDAWLDYVLTNPGKPTNDPCPF